MQVTFISHASVLVRAQGGTVPSDPWYEGKVFNNGWALVSEPHPVDFSSIDYIWISPERPDHLNFPTLKQIPEQHKRRLTILYQRHASPQLRYIKRRIADVSLAFAQFSFANWVGNDTTRSANASRSWSSFGCVMTSCSRAISWRYLGV